MTEPGSQEADFDQALVRLERVVARMESGEVGLEQAVALFEEGQRHLEVCTRRLAEIERRIEELSPADPPQAAD